MFTFWSSLQCLFKNIKRCLITYWTCNFKVLGILKEILYIIIIYNIYCMCICIYVLKVAIYCEHLRQTIKIKLIKILDESFKWNKGKLCFLYMPEAMYTKIYPVNSTLSKQLVLNALPKIWIHLITYFPFKKAVA